MEAVKASDTWLRAKRGDVRGALLLLWAESWQQTPCGSLPDDDELIALLIDMAPPTFAKHRAILLRGWTLADDGRLYHETITKRVLDMMAKRAKDAKRSADRRARNADSHDAPPEVTDASRVTTGGVLPKSDTKHQAPSTSTEPKGSEDLVEFEIVWIAYPKRPGASKSSSLKAWRARIKAGATAAEILAGVQRYAAYCAANRTEPQYIKQPSTFFGPDEHFRADWTFTPNAQRTTGAPLRHAGAAAAIFDMDTQETFNA